MTRYRFSFISSFFFLLLLYPAMADCQVLVDRCKLLDQSSPINNIWVDEDNIKWVANTQGLNKVFSLDLVEKVPIPAGTTSLLTIRGGNAKLEWSTSEMQQLVGNVNFTCASYDPKTKTVWLGTKESGAFQITVTSSCSSAIKYRQQKTRLQSDQ
ncbi:MAG: hypothetical protein IPP15_20445 [Saprospiraceae bacterium]|uniref:Uncharacterized protein n=1 Tax=Candidatus Opimibacter skivensis TaxID=2982028 RepID=A0A9D7XS61_9BACT|nr:hypothetical protein [Candidatus Opimibacter skivensis]